MKKKSGVRHFFVISYEITDFSISAQYRKERTYEFENPVVHPQAHCAGGSDGLGGYHADLLRYPRRPRRPLHGRKSHFRSCAGCVGSQVRPGQACHGAVFHLSERHSHRTGLRSFPEAPWPYGYGCYFRRHEDFC